MSKLDKTAYSSLPPVGAFLKATNLLLLITLAAAMLVSAPVFAQSAAGTSTRPGSILGTVVDINNDPIPNATVVLEGTAPADRRTLVTKEDGVFEFSDVTPGSLYTVTVSAEGLSHWSSSVTVEPREKKTLTDVKLHLQAVKRSVTVGYSPKEAAAVQVKAEEQQRMFRYIPNIYVVYDPHPEPLTTKMKFRLAYKSLTHPVFFARAAFWAGVQQAGNTSDYGGGAEGFGKRLGAATADGVTEGLVGNAILPALLHQDPRYYFQGTGTTKSRVGHAILAPFITPGDNGKNQPNYSTWGGLLVSASIANAYLPDSNRGASHVFKSFGIGMGMHVASSLAQELILNRFTSRGKHPSDK